MKPIILTDRAVLLEGDAANVRAVFAPGTVHSIVTDPPAGIGFMGKGWDSDKGGREQWVAWLADVLRGAHELLVPGGHALVWALPRTAHWTMTALEDAGFEIRDVVSHLFGTGFPKSLDVSKAIDKAAGATREVLGVDKAKLRPNQAKLGLLGMGGGGVFGADNGATITAPATAEAAAWAGWGTALKPGAEFWILARKPLSGTVATNVLAHGTGALNIDGCRIASPDVTTIGFSEGAQSRHVGTYNAGKVSEPEPRVTTATPSGRWPANVVLSHATDCVPLGTAFDYADADGCEEVERFACVSECAVRLLDGQTKAAASRFFYVPKISRAERDLGCEALPLRAGHEMVDREEGSAGLNSPRAGAGAKGGARNHHPTVKPQALMRWLIRLITPPGGTVLDLFAGSGSTGVAALAEGCSFIGVELSPEYLPIAAARITRALDDSQNVELPLPLDS